MAIQTSDVKVRLTTKSGSAGNTLAQTDPNQSLGRYVATTDWLGGTLHDLFAVVTGVANAALEVNYRCLMVYNSHATLTLQSAVIWLSAETSGGSNIALGVDPTAASAVGAAPAQALSIASETVAPAGVAFSSPTTQGAGLSLGNIAPGQVKAFWVRRTNTNASALTPDAVTISISGDSDA